LEWFQQIYTSVSIVNFFLAAILIFMERRNIAATWAWLMVLLFLPGLGFIIYLFLGQRLSQRRLYKLREGQFSRFLKTVEAQKQQLRNRVLPLNDPAMQAHQDLLYLNLETDTALYTQDNEVEVFTEGNGLFRSLLQDIREAQDHIHLQFFIVRNDELGRQVMAALTERALAGVTVRFLYDALGSRGVNARFFRELTEAGGTVTPFFPSRIPHRYMWINYRNHRKLAVIDGNLGYIGGFNIGDEYLGLDQRMGYWRDTHLRIKGSAVHVIQARFLLDWNLAAEGDHMGEEPRYFPDIRGEGRVGIQVVSSGPNSEKEQIKHAYLKMIYQAQKRIYLQSPYLVPDESLLAALKNAAMSGVDVRIMLPARPDHVFVYWASLSYLGELLQSGVRCFLYEKGFLHAKMLTVDGELSSVGSANLDIRSFRINFETNAFLFDRITTRQLEEIFLIDLADCVELTPEAFEQRPWQAKLKESLARLLSPIL